MNPLYKALNQNQNPYDQLISAAHQLKNQMPNPEQEVQRLLSSGQITQEQFNNAMQFAQQIVNTHRNRFN